VREIERRIKKIEDEVQKGRDVTWIFFHDPADDGRVSMGETVDETETRAFTEPYSSESIRIFYVRPRVRGWICQNWESIIPEAQQVILERAVREKEFRFLRCLEQEGVELPIGEAEGKR
jgi:hypothetical protein